MARLARKSQQVRLPLQKRRGLTYFSKEVKRQLKNDVLDIKLYGSYARGDATPRSDIDVLVILKKLSQKRENAIYDTTVTTLQKYDTLISLMLMDEKTYLREKSLPSLFVQFIEQEGIPL